VVVSS